MEDRYLREQTFHDRVYDEGVNDNFVSKHINSRPFYSILGSAHEQFYSLLYPYCPGRRLLENVCGRGEPDYLRDLAERGAQISAIDISEVAVEQVKRAARRDNLDIDARVMNAEDLDFEDGEFDVVAGSAIIHHLNLKKAFTEITRVLNPSGVAIFEEPLGHNPFINLYRRLTPHLRTEDEHPLRTEDFELARSFFGNVQVYYFGLLPLLVVPFRSSRFFPTAVKLLDVADRFLFRLLPFTRKYAWSSVLFMSQPKKSRSMG